MCTIPAFTFLSARGAGSAYMEGSLGSCMQVSQKVSCNGGVQGHHGLLSRENLPTLVTQPLWVMRSHPPTAEWRQAQLASLLYPHPAPGTR